MLILLPPSESKTAPDAGPSVDLSALSFPELTEAREAMLERLIEVSSRDDAADLLKTGPSLTTEVQRNTRLAHEASAPALDVYTGVLFDALDYPSLSTDAKERARRSVVVISALWGAVRPEDVIPAYRLSMGSRVAPKGSLAAWWRSELKPVLDEYSRGHLVIDCRSSSYAAVWKAPSERTVTIRVVRELDGKRQVVSHMAKYFRGKVARALLESATVPESVPDLVDILESQWKVEIESDASSGQYLTLVLGAD
ncbi:YaaA family protein [Rothia uropygialis]|uniref:YaaA family protein n=1 Tax=Kocuria sp. 36 TaxID=1415402 RepID=UPI00101D2F0A|nr:peroxide stress protein YaaA [Kocuria sp. 36]